MCNFRGNWITEDLQNSASRLYSLEPRVPELLITASKSFSYLSNQGILTHDLLIIALRFNL